MDFPFFPVGQPRPEPSPKIQPLQVAFSLLEGVDLRSQKEGDLGEEQLPREGWDGQGEERTKRIRKKGWEKHLYPGAEML